MISPTAMPATRTAASPGPDQAAMMPMIPTQEVMTLLHQLARLTASVAVRPVPLAEWRESVLAKYQRRARSTRNRMRQAIDLAMALSPTGASTDSLTTELVERLAMRPSAPETVAGLMRALRAACNLAVASGSLASCPFGPETPWPDSDETPRRRHHSRADLAKVLAHLELGSADWEGGRLYALAATLAYSGLRKLEALRLRVEDVDLPRSILQVRRHGRKLKTRKSAAPVPMPGPLVSIMGAWLPRCGADWVFPGSKGLGPWTGGMAGKTARCRLKAAALEVGVPGFYPQSLRRSCATHLRGRHGLSPAQVQLVLRHSSQETQRLYLEDDLANLAELVTGFDYSA
jgi:integrase